jgi:hypothetical protein
MVGPPSFKVARPGGCVARNLGSLVHVLRLAGLMLLLPGGLEALDAAASASTTSGDVTR